MEFVYIQFIRHPQIDQESAGQACGQTDQVYKESSFETFDVSKD
jgi:hypothetical protein